MPSCESAITNKIVQEIEIPGNAAVVINVPTSRKKSTMPRDEIDARASKDVALGIVPIVEFDD